MLYKIANYKNLLFYFLIVTIFYNCSSQPEYSKSSGINSKNNDIINIESLSQMVLIQGGTFYSGNNEKYFSDNPKKLRTIESFYLDIHEVTVDQYRKIIDTNDNVYLNSKDILNHPITNVSQENASLFCTKIGRRLPTEWEWEYAAGGKEHYPYHNGKSFDFDNYCANSKSKNKSATCPVKSYKPNSYGLYDMEGNAHEWTSSIYDDKTRMYVFRGASWKEDESFFFNVAFRYYYHEPYTLWKDTIGFRCAK